jgi:hypothetical protein
MKFEFVTRLASTRISINIGFQQKKMFALLEKIQKNEKYFWVGKKKSLDSFFLLE